jgi:hypothetical protein
MEVYKTKIKHVPGTSYVEVYSQAKFLYKQIASKTRRKPFVRSKYFDGEKVFLDYFWDHISKKNPADRLRRLKQYSCALDLIKNCTIAPEIKEDQNDTSKILYRFTGCNGNNEIFYVQITEEKKSNKKYFLSVFPANCP